MLIAATAKHATRNVTKSWEIGRKRVRPKLHDVQVLQTASFHQEVTVRDYSDILDVGQSIQICISQICCLIREFLEAVSRATQTHGVQGTRSTRLE